MSVAKPLLAAALMGAVTVWATITGGAALAGPLAAPQGEVILVISGAITNTNADGAAAFDLQMLQALPQHGFATSTIWTEGVASYKGVLLADLLRAVGGSGTTLTATALNDYQIDIPVAEITDEAPLLAYEVNGEPMPVREKGPLWVIYPYDQSSAYRTEQTYARSIWQVDLLEIAD